jgi:hypothetical protein
VRNEDRDTIIRLRQEAILRVDAARSGDEGFLHGEVFPRSFRPDAGGGLNLGTLEYSGVGDRLYDLAILRWVLLGHDPEHADVLFDSFLAGYSDHRELPRTLDHEVILGWVVLRHLWAMRHAWVVAQKQGLAGFVRNTDGLHRRVEFAPDWNGR